MRIRDFAAVKNLLEQLGVVFSVFIHNMRVLIRDYLGLCVTGVTLHRFDVTTGELQFVSDAGMAKRVENNFWQVVFLN